MLLLRSLIYFLYLPESLTLAADIFNLTIDFFPTHVFPMVKNAEPATVAARAAATATTTTAEYISDRQHPSPDAAPKAHSKFEMDSEEERKRKRE